MSAAKLKSSTGPSSCAIEVSIRGAPTSAIVMSRNSSIFERMASRSCRMQRMRSSVLVDQSVVSKARRAASIARLMSPASASAAVPSTSSVAGLIVGYRPALPATSLPSMKRSLFRSAAIAICVSRLLIGHLSEIVSLAP